MNSVQHALAVVAAMTLQVITRNQRAYYGESAQLSMGDRAVHSPIYALTDSQQRVTDMDDQEYQSWACMVHPGTMNLIPHMGNFGAAEDLGSPAQQAYRHRKTITATIDARPNGDTRHFVGWLECYEQGDEVTHRKWGRGTVLRCDEEIATVKFGGWDDHHIRKIHIDWLDPAEDEVVA